MIPVDVLIPINFVSQHGRLCLTKLKRMKFLWTVLATAMLMLVVTTGHTNPNDETLSYNYVVKGKVSAEVIANRIAELPLPFEGRNTAQVRTYIRSYLVEGYRGSEDILGRAALYFPIFEHYLKLYNLPEELKFLPIVESALRPTVHSPVGAAGLWQFTASTARLYGLTVNSQIDERLDPHKATEAAVRMLAALHTQFGDWGLALAAYNCGPGRVRKAIRASGKKDFWSIQGFLPRESQRYIPGFIAAAYLMNYYTAHNLTPDYPDYDMLDTRTFIVTRSLHLGTVGRQLGVNYQILRKLNPSFQNGLIAANDKGNFITVPGRISEVFMDKYLSLNGNLNVAGRTKSHYTTVAGDDIETLSLLFQCSKNDIISWNNLSTEHLAINQQLIIFLPQRVVRP